MKYILSTNNKIYKSKQGAQRAAFRDFPNAHVVHLGGLQSNIMLRKNVVATIVRADGKGLKSPTKGPKHIPTIEDLENALNVRQKIDALKNRLSTVLDIDVEPIKA